MNFDLPERLSSTVAFVMQRDTQIMPCNDWDVFAK
jgi:hypothetical protein